MSVATDPNPPKSTQIHLNLFINLYLGGYNQILFCFKDVVAICILTNVN